MTILQNSILTTQQRREMANDVYNNWQTANVYMMVGGEDPFPLSDTLIPVPNDSINYINNVWRNSIAMKKILASDMAFMVPRINWQSGVTYNFWDSAVDMYSTLSYTTLTGNVTSNVSNNIITGNGTQFATQLNTGEFIFIPGDGINAPPIIKEVVNIISNTSLVVNSAFSNTYIANSFYEVVDNSPYYAQNFYVKNSLDQVFICLFNNANAQSTIEPSLSIGGDLPTDPWIQTADGYKWKYLYTIPAGQKLLFISDAWMPVYSDPTVVEFAVDGRLDIILINNGGTGYNQNLASNTASILTVVGDGTGANLSAKVNSSGSIFDINILNGGRAYTLANVAVTAGVTGTGANLRPIIGPLGGHGANPAAELGASVLQLTMTLNATEGGTLPTVPSIGTGTFEYRQISIVSNPLLTGGNTATGQNYSTVSTITVQPLPAGSFFTIDETVYQGPSLANATFSASVVYWDDTNDIIWVNGIVGTFTPSAPIVGTVQSNPVTAFFITPPVIDLYSGDMLYINNISPVIRGANQEEYIRVLLKF